MKEHGKNPPEQVTEAEMGSIPEREVFIMIVKMIQNFDNKIRVTYK